MRASLLLLSLLSLSVGQITKPLGASPDAAAEMQQRQQQQYSQLPDAVGRPGGEQNRLKVLFCTS